MGSLILPPSGFVYVDANLVIYAVEKIEPYCSFLAPLWLAAQIGQVSIVTSELTWLETLVKPMRDGNAALELLFRAFLTNDAAFVCVPGLPATVLSAAISS